MFKYEIACCYPITNTGVSMPYILIRILLAKYILSHKEIGQGSQTSTGIRMKIVLGIQFNCRKLIYFYVSLTCVKWPLEIFNSIIMLL